MNKKVQVSFRVPAELAEQITAAKAHRKALVDEADRISYAEAR